MGSLALAGVSSGIGRNDPCPCGSGKKYKKCCLLAASGPAGRAGGHNDAAEAFSQGNALLKRRNLKGAAVAYKKAIASNPEHFNAHMNLAGVLLEQDDREGAVRHLKRAAELDDTSTMVHTHLAQLYTEFGQRKEAEASIWKALQLDPNDVPALCHLARLLRGTMPQEQLGRMSRLLCDRSDLSDTQRKTLHAMIAPVFDGRKEYAAAAEHMEQANALAKAELAARGRSYDLESFRYIVERSIEIYTPEYSRATCEMGLDSDKPVFVVGMPRSGTTLAESILSGHRDVFGIGERPHIGNYFSTLPKIKGSSLKPVDCLGLLDGPEITRMARDYLRSFPAEAAKALRVVDKTPRNSILLGLVVALFPKARIICMRRDPRDIAMSCWMVQFERQRWACDKQWLGGYIRGNLRMMDHWSKVLPAGILEVEYEKLVTDPQGEARRMIEWLGLPWDPACLNFHESTRRIRTASLVQVRQGIHSGSVGRWRNYRDYLHDLFDAVTDQ